MVPTYNNRAIVTDSSANITQTHLLLLGNVAPTARGADNYLFCFVFEFRVRELKWRLVLSKKSYIYGFIGRKIFCQFVGSLFFARIFIGVPIIIIIKYLHIFYDYDFITRNRDYFLSWRHVFFRSSVFPFKYLFVPNNILLVEILLYRC